MQESTHFHNLGGTRSTIAVPACMEWGSEDGSPSALQSSRTSSTLRNHGSKWSCCNFLEDETRFESLLAWHARRMEAFTLSFNKSSISCPSWLKRKGAPYARTKQASNLLVNESFGPTQIWSYIFKCWANIGQNLARCWQMFDQVWQGCQSRLPSVTKFGNCYFFLKPAHGL